MVAGNIGGEGVNPEGKKQRFCRGSMLRERVAEMYVMRLKGKSTVEIAAKYRMSRQMVNRHIKNIPEPMKEIIRQRFTEDRRAKRRVA